MADFLVQLRAGGGVDHPTGAGDLDGMLKFVGEKGDRPA